jgi:hypothetical protein
MELDPNIVIQPHGIERETTTDHKKTGGKDNKAAMTSPRMSNSVHFRGYRCEKVVSARRNRAKHDSRFPKKGIRQE